MPFEDILTRMREIFPDLSRKRRRSSNFADGGPPPKVIRNVHEHRFVRDEPQRQQSTGKSILRSMGSILSKFKSHANTNGCEPTECEEYSDGEDVIILQKFKKSDIIAPRHQPINNYQFDKMDAVNNMPSANRPPPGLIPRKKWSRVPDLQKIVPQPRVNGHQYDCESSSIGNHVINGTTLSHNRHYIDSTSGNRYSNFINSASMGPKFPSLVSLKPIPIHNAAEDRLRFERLLRNAVPDYCVADPLPTSTRPTTVQNHISPRPKLQRQSEIHSTDDDLSKKHEDIRRRFAETSITSEYKVAPSINPMRIIKETSIVCKKQFPDFVNEKYSQARAQRQERISQQEEKSKQLTSDRIKHCSSYENLTPAWYTPSVFVSDEDIEEKIDDFPEFTDAQRQTIRGAMVGHEHINLITKFNIQITRKHILTLQWEPLAWLNDEVINFYMNLLTERGELRANDGYPKVYAMNTFFIPRLLQSGHSGVKRWTKKVDLFACDIIPVPVHVGNVHWCMAIINMKEKTIKYYDSMGAPNQRVLYELEDYLKKESLDKRKIEFDTNGWSKENVTDNPRQENGSDCGVFSCMTAEFICRNRPITFTQQHMNYFRQKMVLEICTGTMLL